MLVWIQGLFMQTFSMFSINIYVLAWININKYLWDGHVSFLVFVWHFMCRPVSSLNDKFALVIRGNKLKFLTQDNELKFLRGSCPLSMETTSTGGSHGGIWDLGEGGMCHTAEGDVAMCSQEQSALATQVKGVWLQLLWFRTPVSSPLCQHSSLRAPCACGTQPKGVQLCYCIPSEFAPGGSSFCSQLSNTCLTSRDSWGGFHGPFLLPSCQRLVPFTYGLMSDIPLDMLLSWQEMSASSPCHRITSGIRKAYMVYD